MTDCDSSSDENPRPSHWPETDPHAIIRLRERYGLELSFDGLIYFQWLLSSPPETQNLSRVRLVRKLQSKRVVYQLNLVHLLPDDHPAKPLGHWWIPCIFDAERQRIVTFPPYEVNLTIRQIDESMRMRKQRGKRSREHKRGSRWHHSKYQEVCEDDLINELIDHIKSDILEQKETAQ